MKHIGQTLKRHIEEYELKKVDVAEKVGITYNYLSTIFKKETIDCLLFERICKVIGMSPASIFENSEPSKVNSDNQAIGFLGNANISLGMNEKLYKQLLAEKERYIRLLERQLGISSETIKEQS